MENENNPNNFKKKLNEQTNIKSNSSSYNFGKSIILPFFSGILGASLILGVCFNVPQLKSTLIGQANNQSSEINYNNINTDLVSISSFSDTGIAVAQKILPSVVGIKVTYPVSSIFSQNTSTTSAEGSGVIISEDGYILTNNHVVNSTSSNQSAFYSIGEATNLTVKLYNDETEYPAKIIGSDELTDLAVIKIDKDNLTAATLGDSDSIQVGEWCMAAGNPLGMISSVTTGSISALNRTIQDENGKTFTLIQTDAAINSGNSGGALVNSKGEVIGINTIKASGTGIEGLGFAIPINSTKSITKDLIEYQKVKRPFLGIAGTTITEKTIKNYPTANLVVGAYIKTIQDFSPAQKAGLKIGDIITKIDNSEIKSIEDVQSIVRSHKIDDEITVTIVRDNNTQEIKVKLAEQP